MTLEKDFYTIEEVCAMFSVTRATVYSWMNHRGVAYVRIGPRRRITAAAIEAFVRSENTESSSVYNTDTTKAPGQVAAH